MTTINQEVLQGQWRQIRGYIQRRWGDITDSDLDRIQGRADELVGLLQVKYGYTKEQAQQQVEYVIDVFDESKKQWVDTMPDMPTLVNSRRTQLIMLAGLVGIGLIITVLLRSRD